MTEALHLKKHDLTTNIATESTKLHVPNTRRVLRKHLKTTIQPIINSLELSTHKVFRAPKLSKVPAATDVNALL